MVNVETGIVILIEILLVGLLTHRIMLYKNSKKQLEQETKRTRGILEKHDNRSVSLSLVIDKVLKKGLN